MSYDTTQIRQLKQALQAKVRDIILDSTPEILAAIKAQLGHGDTFYINRDGTGSILNNQVLDDTEDEFAEYVLRLVHSDNLMTNVELPSRIHPSIKPINHE